MVVLASDEILVWETDSIELWALHSNSSPPPLYYCHFVLECIIFGIHLYLVALSSLTEPLCPEINKRGKFRDWISCSSYNTYYYLYEKWWHVIGSGPWAPNSSTWFPSHCVTGSDVL